MPIFSTTSQQSSAQAFAYYQVDSRSALCLPAQTQLSHILALPQPLPKRSAL
jgi:hypothetical protein